MKLASFEALARALEVAGVRYLVAGGLAVNAHGYIRRALMKPLYATIEVRFVSIPTLIRMKELAGRPHDHIDIEHLRMMLSGDEHG